MSTLCECNRCCVPFRKQEGREKKGVERQEKGGKGKRAANILR